MNRSFSINHTLYVKGIAILALCWHHLYWHNVTLPINLCDTNYMDVMTVVTKVCVAAFTILSGYGMNASFLSKKEKLLPFSLQHIWKLLKNYWWVYVPAFILSFRFHVQGTPWQIYGQGGRGVFNFLLDFLGMRAFIYSPTLNNTWWYIETALVFYLLFPVFRLLLEKVPLLLLTVGAVPVTLASVGIFWKPLITTDRELFYVLPFVLGMMFSEYGVLDRIVEKSRKWPVQFGLASVLFAVMCALMRTVMPMITDVVYAVALILVGVALANVPGRLIRIFPLLGRFSMDIYLTHSLIYYYFKPTSAFLLKIPNYFARFFILVLINVVIAFILILIKKQTAGFLAHMRKEKRECRE